MKKYKVKELTGAKLDAAVAKAEGKNYGFGAMRGDPSTKMCFIEPPETRHDRTPDWFCPSSNWLDGGPIIEREKICLICEGGEWRAAAGADADMAAFYGYRPAAEGNDALGAAMRAFVASKFGEEVEL